MESQNHINVLVDKLSVTTQCAIIDQSKFTELFSPAIDAFDILKDCVCHNDTDVEYLWEDTRNDLVNSIQCAIVGLKRPSLIMLRGVLEGVLTTLFYREQSISLALWADNKCFIMAHQLLEPCHEFYRYFIRFFKDERFSLQYPNIPPKCCLERAEKLYSELSNSVHKKRAPEAFHVEDYIEYFNRKMTEVLQLSLSFLERIEDLPSALKFPVPLTYPAQLCLAMPTRRTK